MSRNQKISIVVPIFNEQDSILALYNQINLELKNFDREIVFINDGSSDNSKEIISDIIANDKNVVMIDFMKNFGKATGLSEAFKIAKGDIVVTIDGDLQDDPSEIKNLISKINSGSAICSALLKLGVIFWVVTSLPAFSVLSRVIFCTTF